MEGDYQRNPYSRSKCLSPNNCIIMSLVQNTPQTILLYTTIKILLHPTTVIIRACSTHLITFIITLAYFDSFIMTHTFIITSKYSLLI